MMAALQRALAVPVASAAMSERQRQRRLKKLRRQIAEKRRERDWYRAQEQGRAPDAPTRTLENRLPAGPARPGVPEGRYAHPDARSAAVRPGPRPRRPLSGANTAMPATRSRPSLAGYLGRRPRRRVV